MDLKINYGELNSVGNQVSAKGGEFTELLSKIKSINSELQSYWEGTDASKYTAAVAQQAETMQKLANTIDEIGLFLVKAGEAYQEACQNNANAING